MLFFKILKISNFQKRFIIPILFVSLFIWRFSYWRNNGLGDFGRVPITSNYEIEMIDFVTASIAYKGESADIKGRAQGIEKLYVEDYKVYYFTGRNYRILDAKGDETYINGLNLEKFKLMGGDPKKLMSPDKFHSDYWGYSILFY